MTLQPSTPLPPHLSMDDYLDFVEASFRATDKKKARRQKEIEERITAPFSYSPCRGKTDS